MQSIYLDAAIAIAFVFLLFSVLAYVIQEWWASIRESRAKMLEYAIGQVLNDSLNKSFGVLLYEHPQIDLLKRTQNSIPSYIPAENFTSALVDLISRECIVISYVADELTGLLKEVTNEKDLPPDVFSRFAAGVEKMNHSELKILLQSFLQSSQNLAQLKPCIVNWFNEYMNRVTGWYKRDVKVPLRVIAIGIVLFFNVDAIYLVQNIFHNNELRNTLVAAAEKTVDQPSEINSILGSSIKTQLGFLDSAYKAKIKVADSAQQILLNNEWTKQRQALADSMAQLRKGQYDDLVKQINGYGLPIGWNLPVSETATKKTDTIPAMSAAKNSFAKMAAYFEYYQNQKTQPGMYHRTIWTILLGWFISALCISFGAPFWFDLLGRLVRLRRTGIKPKDGNASSDTNSNS